MLSLEQARQEWVAKEEEAFVRQGDLDQKKPPVPLPVGHSLVDEGQHPVPESRLAERRPLGLALIWGGAVAVVGVCEVVCEGRRVRSWLVVRDGLQCTVYSVLNIANPSGKPHSMLR